MAPVTPDVTLDDVRAAAARIEGAVVRTPAARSQTLSDVLGAEVVVKLENLQFTASFKERGALNRLLTLTADERRRGVVAVSAGNHAQAVARHAVRLGVDATIVMPRGTPWLKVERTEALGARVVLHGDDLGTAWEQVDRLVRDEGLVFVHPYDDPAVIAGQGTVALELLEDHPDLDVMVVPAGGGGLAAGMAVVGAGGAPPVPVVAVQSDRSSALAGALGAAGAGAAGGATIAEGIAVPVPGPLALALLRRHGAEALTVAEDTIETAVNLLIEVEKLVAEGAGAAGIAALDEHRARFAGRKVGVVVTGGNVDTRLLASVLLRGLVRSGRLARLRIEVPDLPGNLGRVTTALGELGANIVELTHQRMFLDVPARVAELEVVVETHDADHLDEVVAGLVAAGLRVRRQPVNRLPSDAG